MEEHSKFPIFGLPPSSGPWWGPWWGRSFSGSVYLTEVINSCLLAIDSYPSYKVHTYIPFYHHYLFSIFFYWFNIKLRMMDIVAQNAKRRFQAKQGYIVHIVTTQIIWDVAMFILRDLLFWWQRSIELNGNVIIITKNNQALPTTSNNTVLESPYANVIQRKKFIINVSTGNSYSWRWRK